MFPFKANYGQDPRIEFKRRKKGKYIDGDQRESITEQE